MARHTKHEALETRNALLDAAERVFSKRGVSRTSLADIAAAAGVTRGAIYWHFADKADLFWAMLSRVRLPLEMEAECDGEAGPEPDPIGQIKRRMLRALLTVALQPQAQRVIDIVCHKCEFVEDMTALRTRYLTMRGNCIAQIEGEVARARAAGLLRPDIDPHLAAIGLHALLDGLISNWLVGRDRAFFPLARDAERLVDMFIDGMRRPGTARHAARRAGTGAAAPRTRTRPARTRTAPGREERFPVALEAAAKGGN
jgi:TetR/AcrR family acrAB operon transcriptional repressor